MKSVRHPLTAADRRAMGTFREAVAEVRFDFAPESRDIFDEIIGRTAAAEGVTFEQSNAAGLPGWWCRPDNARPDAVILYLHGGAYVIGSTRAYRNFVGHVAARSGVMAFALEYPLAPEFPFPAAVEDAYSAYRGLAGTFRSVALVGDSAGGGLALVTLHQAMHGTSEGANPPRCAVAFSPWTDLTLSGGSLTTRAEADLLIREEAMRGGAERYLNGRSPTDPRVSPLFADKLGLPPIQLHVGEDEILLDDATRYAESLHDAEESELHVWEGMPHVFASHVGEFEAAEAALDGVARFLERHLD